jgi:hypothetical protein
MRELLFVITLGGLALVVGCARDQGASVSAQRSAVTADPNATDPLPGTPSNWDPDKGPPAWLQQMPLPTRPADPRFLSRQQAYIQAVAQKHQEWRAAGRTDDEIEILRADLKRQMLSE